MEIDLGCALSPLISDFALKNGSVYNKVRLCILAIEVHFINHLLLAKPFPPVLPVLPSVVEMLMSGHSR